tara:strand:- start:584 stop:913 length:330 start_codon:yes stop_codon:yes gene_type:complete
MKPKILQTPADHRAALDRVEALMDSAPGSAEEQALELWALLIENYEAKHQPVPPPDPIEAIRFRIDQLGLKASSVRYPTGCSLGRYSWNRNFLRGNWPTGIWIQTSRLC